MRISRPAKVFDCVVKAFFLNQDVDVDEFLNTKRESKLTIYQRYVRASAFVLLATMTLQTVWAQPAEVVASESRDAATAYIGTSNFIVGRIGRDCLALVGRNDTPQQFVGNWQQRNLKYVAASAKYMEKRLDEAQTSGGIEKRNAVVREVTTIVQNNGGATVRSWIERGDKLEACKRAIAIVDAGGMDISPRVPMFSELEALAVWAQ